MFGRVELSERLCEFLLDCGKAIRVRDLLAGAVGDVEGVEHLIEMRGDFGEFDLKVEAVDRSADRVEQAGAVVGEDADDVAAVGRIVVDGHSVGEIADRSLRALPTEAARALEHLIDFDFLAE